jgi:hypothetical protein
MDVMHRPEFAYTGRIVMKAPSNSEDASNTLRDLLDLLEISIYWELPRLKTRIEKLIAADLKLVNPDTYQHSKCILQLTTG